MVESTSIRYKNFSLLRATLLLGFVHVQAAQQNIPIFHLHLRTSLVTYFSSRRRSLWMPQSQVCPSDDEIGDFPLHLTSWSPLFVSESNVLKVSSWFGMITHVFARISHETFPVFSIASLSLNVPTLLILNTMQCQDILHFRNPTTSRSNLYLWIVHTSDIVLHSSCWFASFCHLYWTSCVFFLLR